MTGSGPTSEEQILVVSDPACPHAKAVRDALGAQSVDDFRSDRCAAAHSIVIVSAASSGDSLEAMTLAKFQSLMRAELDGPWHAIRAALGGSRASGRSIVHLFQIDPSQLHLSSAAELLLRSAARETGCREGAVRLNAVQASTTVPLEEVVAAIGFLLSPASRFMTGDTMRLGLPQ